MQDYNFFDIEVLATDPLFRKFVLSPDASSEKFWYEWKAINDQKYTIYAEAVIVVAAFNGGYRDGLTSDVINHKIDKIKSQITSHQ
ncbi:hypothetical protein [Dyadobacter sp. CY312]|uniref:hypothetical protein n=1 Tax=Dyadobacter sp. CY312 TaxID=2907303 RepID=UPI001F28EE3B|nr:hypothetical protein [Dyadobacter sp. CY312]MCE7044565.1 hypothetical protein [Dyadobacter sp. CY312]